MKKIVTLLSIVALVSGCMMPLGKISTYQMIPKLEYRGFTVKRPADTRWYLNISEQDHTKAMFRMDDTQTHTIFASIGLEGIEKQPASIDEFEQIVKSVMTAPSSNGTTKVLEYTSTKSMKQGQWCINYSSKSLALSAKVSDRPLVMTIKGFAVLHPSWPKTVVNAHISQRGDEKDISPEIDKIGEQLLDGVRLESAPGKEI